MQQVVERALSLIADGMTIGLGTGRAASAFIQALGPRVQKGLRVQGVPTSEASAVLARESGVPVIALGDAGEMDLCFDGADEVDPNLDLIKGYGGALVREKIVAASSRKFIVLVGAEKVVPKLGDRRKLPVEVVPFSLPLCCRALEKLGLRPVLRSTTEKKTFVSDNGNYILDCGLDPIDKPYELERSILAIPGVVDSGLFLNMASVVLIQEGDRVVEKTRA